MNNSFPKPLTSVEEQKYVKLMETGDIDAKNILIERNLRLVAHIAKKYVTNSNQDDLISIGTIGLIKGINTYRSSKCTRLSTYAAKCIENEILMSIRSRKKIKQEVSLSVPLGTDKDGNEINFNDILGTDTNIIVDLITLNIQISELYQAMNKVLNEREKYIIVNRYGLYNKPIITQNEVAKKLEISRSYVSRIEKKALNKLYLCLKSTII